MPGQLSVSFAMLSPSSSSSGGTTNASGASISWASAARGTLSPSTPSHAPSAAARTTTALARRTHRFYAILELPADAEPDRAGALVVLDRVALGLRAIDRVVLRRHHRRARVREVPAARQCDQPDDVEEVADGGQRRVGRAVADEREPEPDGEPDAAAEHHELAVVVALDRRLARLLDRVDRGRIAGDAEEVLVGQLLCALEPVPDLDRVGLRAVLVVVDRADRVAVGVLDDALADLLLDGGGPRLDVVDDGERLAGGHRAG